MHAAGNLPRRRIRQSGPAGPSRHRDRGCCSATSRCPLIQAAGLDPNSVKVVLLNDPEINAFVATGQTVYLQSGLLEAADNVNQLQGVIAHELGHVAGGHSIRIGQGVRRDRHHHPLAGPWRAAIAAGAGDAGMGIMWPGNEPRSAISWPSPARRKLRPKRPAREFLSQAGDQRQGHARLLREAAEPGISARDLPTRTASTGPTRFRPSGSRRSSRSSKPTRRGTSRSIPALEARFQRVKAKLFGFLESASRRCSISRERPERAGALCARLRLSSGRLPATKPMSEANALLVTAPHDPFFLELKGQILLESGKPADAIAPLREATQRSGDAPLIAAMLGHALVATEDPKYFVEAKQVLKTAVNRDNEDPFAWYQLGIIYDREGDEARAQLATAERSNLEGNPKHGLASAQMAMKGIPAGIVRTGFELRISPWCRGPSLRRKTSLPTRRTSEQQQ